MLLTKKLKICHLVSCFFAEVKKDRALHSHSGFSAKVLKSTVNKHWPCMRKEACCCSVQEVLWKTLSGQQLLMDRVKRLFLLFLMVWSLLNIHHDPPVFPAPHLFSMPGKWVMMRDKEGRFMFPVKLTDCKQRATVCHSLPLSLHVLEGTLTSLASVSTHCNTLISQ